MQKIGYWPSPEYLRKRSMLGSLELGQKKIGAENRSEGSDFIIQLADEKDSRPIWILAWGGANTFAQAIWQVEQTRTADEVKRFLNKFRVYTITDQDTPWSRNTPDFQFSSHYRMRRDLSKDLMFFWDESAWLSQNDIGARNWDEYAKHIQKHGCLGSIYPKNKWGVEGDTPSFLHVLPNGLNDPSSPSMVGWGGYFEWGLGKDTETYCYTNHAGQVKSISQKYENYFYPAIFNNFAARMDWAAQGKGNRNPVVIVNGKKGLEIIHIKAKAGETVWLDASRSFDFENDELSFRWWNLAEAGSCKEDVEIRQPHSSKTGVVVPEKASNTTIHIVCEVSDNGTPALTAYRRVVIDVR